MCERRFSIFKRRLTVWLFMLVSSLLLPATSFAQAMICGSVFLDQNQNRVKDSGELLRANQVIYLIDQTLINQGQGGYFTTVTGEAGQYCLLANTLGDYLIWTDIPEGMKLVAPVQAENAMEPYALKITSLTQQVTVDFGLYGVVSEVWGKCQDESKDDSVCVRNADYIMQVTPNGGATEVKPMEVIEENGVYRGDNLAAKVVTGENESGTRSVRKTRDGSDDFSITVGKNVSGTGEEVALDARVNPDNSVSFTDPAIPTVEVTAHADGSYTGLDSTSPSVAVAFDPLGNISATDSDDPTMALLIDKATGKVTVTDSEYPTSTAVINADGSRTITDEEFPDLIATVYANNEYVIQDLENNMDVHIDSQGNYTVIDNKSGVCVAIPHTRGLFSKIWRGIKKVFRAVTRFVSKVAGFVVKVARFIVKVARVISVVARVIAVIAKIAAVLFPPLCPLFCAVAAFAEGVARVSDVVGNFAAKVAMIAQGIQVGTGVWVGQQIQHQEMRKEINKLREEKQEFETTVQIQATRITELKRIVADQARRIQILETEVTEKIAELEELKEENARIQKEINEQAEVVATLENKINDLEERLKKVEEEVETIPPGVPTVPTILEAEVATLKEENARIQEEIAEQAGVNTTLEERLKKEGDILDQFEPGDPLVSFLRKILVPVNVFNHISGETTHEIFSTT